MRSVCIHGEVPFTLILTVGLDNDSGCAFNIGKAIHDRHKDIFDRIANHEESEVQTRSGDNVTEVVMPAGDQAVIRLLLCIRTSEGKARLEESMPEMQLFELAEACQTFECTDKIRSLVDWSTTPAFSEQDETDESCLPEQIYFIGKEFHLPKVLLIGWTRFVQRLFRKGRHDGPIRIHKKEWRGLASRNIRTGGREPQWELLETDTEGKICYPYQRTCN